MTDNVPSQLPPILWHYTTQVGAIGILTSRTLWSTDIRFLNDSSEYFYAADLARQVSDAKRFRDEGLWMGRFRQKICNVVHEQAYGIDIGLKESAIFVTSLSQADDDLSQWRGYGGTGTGYAIGFDTKALEKLARDQGFDLVPCIYDRTKQEQLITALADEAEAEAEYNLKTDDSPVKAVNRALVSFANEFSEYAATLKAAAFSSEAEVRLVSSPVRCGDGRIRVRSGRSTFVPYIEFELQLDNGNLPIVMVRVGPTPNRDLGLLGVRHALSRAGVDLSNCKVVVTQLPFRAW